MSPLAQKGMGFGVVIGFAATFAVGSPITEAGALALTLRSILGGLIFGLLGYITGEFMHRFVVDKLEMEIEAHLTEKELKRQEKRRRVQEQLETMKAAGISPDVEFTAEFPEAESPAEDG
jgi:hypothetical protein